MSGNEPEEPEAENQQSFRTRSPKKATAIRTPTKTRATRSDRVDLESELAR